MKYPDFSGSPDTLFNLGEALRINNNEPESAIYYARIVSEHPLSERVQEAKQRLTLLNQPIPEPNPVALARAQQASPIEERGLLGKMFGMFSRRPPVPVTTEESSADDSEREDGESGTFSIDPQVVQPEQRPR